jgi:hypothetical protein
MSQPVPPSATIAAGPCTREAITGRPQALASTRTSPNASATEGRTSASAAFSARGSSSCARQPGEEDLPVPDPQCRRERMLPLPLARMAADEHERRRPASNSTARAWALIRSGSA